MNYKEFESDFGLIEVLFRKLLGGTEGNHENSPSG
jgi:hypothetical protein